MALSTAPIPTKGIEDANAMDRLETVDGCALPASRPAASILSALTAASNSCLPQERMPLAKLLPARQV